MFRKLSFIGAVALACAAAMPAQAVVLFSQDGNNAGGSVNLISDTAFTITGGNDIIRGAFFMRGIADSDFTLTGDWLFETTDQDGPLFDPAFTFVNGTRTQLTLNGGPDTQSGSFSLDLLTGDNFGFYVLTTDGGFGAASLNISNLSSTYSFGGTVPEPASWAMLITGFGLVGATMRRRRSALAA